MNGKHDIAPLLPAVRWILVLGYMGLIYALSSIEGTPDGDSLSENVFLLIPPDAQNLLHLPMYGILAWLWCRALAHSAMSQHALTAAAILTIGYGLFDEWHQLHVPGRYASITDLALNTVGAMAGILIYAKWRQKRTAAQTGGD